MALTSVPFTTLDVFTSIRFSGNQLGLVHLPSRASLSESQKQAIATEINYSETVFLYPKSTDSVTPVYPAQIFTPKSEIPFAGHPTIGTAVFIFENFETDQDSIDLDLKAGRMRIDYDRQLKSAKASIAHDVRIHQQALPWSRLAASQLSLEKPASDIPLPLVTIVPGMSWVLVDFTTQPELLNQVTPTPKDPFTPADLDEGRWQQGFTGSLFYKIYPRTDGDPDGLVKVRQRMMGIGLEDPATGSASCALASYLAITQGRDLQVDIEQGFEMGRASRIFVEIKLKPDGGEVAEVKLSGQAVAVTSGTLQID